MSFKDFKNDLLVSIAVVSGAKPTFMREALEIAEARNLQFLEGWLRQAVKSLESQGLIRTRAFMGGGENLGMPVGITGDGLLEAEEICAERGSDLYEEITEYQQGATANEQTGNVDVPASDRVVRIDHNSSQYVEISNKIQSIKQQVSGSNTLRDSLGDQLDQRIAEVEAGEILLKAPITRAELIKEVLIKALKWLAAKVVDNAASILITSVITAIIALLGISL